MAKKLAVGARKSKMAGRPSAPKREIIEAEPHGLNAKAGAKGRPGPAKRSTR